MDELLKAILSGVGAPEEQHQSSSDPMMDMLGGILRGIPNPEPSWRPGQSSGGDVLGDVLGAVLGGGAGGQSSGAISDLMGAVLGGGSAGRGSRQAAANPLVEMLANKLGIPPMIAQMVVSYFMAKMVAGKMGATPGGGAGGNFRPGAARSNALDLDHLLGDVDDDRVLQSNLLSSGMPQELAQHAGIDQETALQSLQEMLKMFAEQNSTPKPVTTSQSNLKGLLDTWDTE